MGGGHAWMVLLCVRSEFVTQTMSGVVFGSSASGNALLIVAFLESYRYRSTKTGDLVFVGSCFSDD